jgi:hypothetical protein
MVDTCRVRLEKNHYVIYFTPPHTISYTDSRNIVRFNFWTGTSYTGDVEKSAETLMMQGTESTDIYLHIMDTQVDDNAGDLEITELGDVLLDSTWVVRNFTFTREGKYEYSWSLTLEKK